MKELYFDYGATTPICEEAQKAMQESFNIYTNPSSLYQSAQQSKHILNESRESVASLINADPSQVFFTSGGTESNNWALNSILHNKTGGILTTSIEHDAILVTARELCSKQSRNLYLVNPKSCGVIEKNDIAKNLEKNNIAMVSAMAVNNETGAVQPVQEIGKIASERSVHFHIDAVQAVGKMPIDVKSINCDSLSISAHKFYGPKGVGVLYIRNPGKFNSWVLGGGQERTLRSGTENLTCIAGMGAAAKLAKKYLEKDMDNNEKKRALLIKELHNLNIENFINGPNEPSERLPGIINISFPGVRAEALAASLSMQHQIAVAIGSACSNNKNRRQSHVLTAMGLSLDRINSAIRISFGRYTHSKDILKLANALQSCLTHLDKLTGAIAEHA